MQILNKCPICGGTLYSDSLYQYSIIHKIGRTGRENAAYKKSNNSPMECVMLYCENEDFKTDYDLDIVKPRGYDGHIINVDGIFVLKNG